MTRGAPAHHTLKGATDDDERVPTLPATAGDIARALGADLVGDPDLEIVRPGTLEHGGPDALGFIRSDTFAKHWADSRCGAAIVTSGIEITHEDPARALLFVPDADEAFVRVLRAADPGKHRPEPGIHPGAIIDKTATIRENAAVGAACVIGAHSVVGRGCVLMPGVKVGAGVTIGDDTVLEPGVVIDDRSVIGARCLIGANSVIGADGFGFLPPNDTRHAVKVPQIGRVVVGDDTELGACVTVDRAKIGETRIGDRVKLDNQIHVGHNATIGDDTIICGRATLGGSCTIGARVMIGGAVTINDQSTVGDDARIAGGAIVLEPVPPGESYAGIPAHPARQAFANYGVLREIASILRKYDKRIKSLERDTPDNLA